jgi:branched-subunit amino acid ABC-type transport system permease component
MIVFLLIVVCIRAFNLGEDSYLLIAINNILVILTVILFLLGILFEVSVIKRVRNTGRKSMLILASILCLIFFQAYFVVVGFIDSVFQIRIRLNNA